MGAPTEFAEKADCLRKPCSPHPPRSSAPSPLEKAKVSLDWMREGRSLPYGVVGRLFVGAIHESPVLFACCLSRRTHAVRPYGVGGQPHYKIKKGQPLGLTFLQKIID